MVFLINATIPDAQLAIHVAISGDNASCVSGCITYRGLEGAVAVAQKNGNV